MMPWRFRLERRGELSAHLLDERTAARERTPTQLLGGSRRLTAHSDVLFSGGAGPRDGGEQCPRIWVKR